MSAIDDRIKALNNQIESAGNEWYYKNVARENLLVLLFAAGREEEIGNDEWNKSPISHHDDPAPPVLTALYFHHEDLSLFPFSGPIYIDRGLSGDEFVGFVPSPAGNGVIMVRLQSRYRECSVFCYRSMEDAKSRHPALMLEEGYAYVQCRDVPKDWPADQTAALIYAARERLVSELPDNGDGWIHWELAGTRSQAETLPFWLSAKQYRVLLTCYTMLKREMPVRVGNPSAGLMLCFEWVQPDDMYSMWCNDAVGGTFRVVLYSNNSQEQSTLIDFQEQKITLARMADTLIERSWSVDVVSLVRKNMLGWIEAIRERISELDLNIVLSQGVPDINGFTSHNSPLNFWQRPIDFKLAWLDQLRSLG